MRILKNWLDRIVGMKLKINQAVIDESSKESFPASDPPSWASGRDSKSPSIESNDIVLIQEFFQHTKQILEVNGMEYHYFSLPAAEQAGLNNLSRLPFALKILLENLLRHLDGKSVTLDDIKAVVVWVKFAAYKYPKHFPYSLISLWAFLLLIGYPPLSSIAIPVLQNFSKLLPSRENALKEKSTIKMAIRIFFNN